VFLRHVILFCGTCLVISKHGAKLRTIIEPDYGLLDELLSLKALSREQYDVIRNITTSVYQRNDQLLQYIAQSDADVLIEALRKTGQTHVANFIQGNCEGVSRRLS